MTLGQASVLRVNAKTQMIKAIDKVDFIKIRNLCASKDTIKKVTR